MLFLVISQLNNKLLVGEYSCSKRLLPLGDKISKFSPG